MKANIKWLDDPQVFRVGQIPAHSDHCFYQSYSEWQKGKSSLMQSLNGVWQFHYSENPMQRPQDFYRIDFDSKFFNQIKVPGEIELAGYAQNQYINSLIPWEGKVYRRPAYTTNGSEAGSFSQGIDNSVGSYLKKFDLNSQLLDKRVRVRFEGVERAMFVWLNGHFLGYSEDSFTPVEFDLTEFIKAKDNLLAVEVFKHSTASWLEDQDMFRFSGIFRNVELIAQPELHLEDLDLKPEVVNHYQDGIFNAKLKLESTNLQGGSVRILIKDQLGKTLLDQTKKLQSVVEIKQQILPSVHLWSNHDPYLYQLLIELWDKSGKLQELIPYKFGFRKIEINKEHVVLLNGKRLIINGVNRHEWNCRSGRTISIAEMQQDLANFKKNNINAVRTCHYPNQIPWYYMCDTAGIYVMAEDNLETHATWQKMGQVETSYNVPGSIPEWHDAVIDRARNNYQTLKNHTAILFWSLGNESYAGENIVDMQKYYQEHDSTRLIHYESVWQIPEYRLRISDLESRMYQSPQEVEAYLQNNPDKPFIQCEYMHDMGNSIGGMGEYIALIDKYPQYLGGFIWDYIDQALLVKDEVTGKEVLRYGGDFDDRHSDYEFSGDGLMFADRTEKPAMQEVRYYYGLHK